MKNVNRSYSAVTLNDGTEGNYFLVQNLFRQLQMLKSERPSAFEAFHSLASLSKPMSEADQKSVLGWGVDLTEYDLSSGKCIATQNAKDVLDLCLRGRNSPAETALRRVFSYFAGEEQPIGFKLVSPFKYPLWTDPSSAKTFDIKPIHNVIAKPTGVDIPSVRVVRPRRSMNRNGAALHITG